MTVAAVLALTILSDAPPSRASDDARAVTETQGSADNLSLRVENASVEQILDRISRAFNFTYSLTAVNGRKLTGRYAGNLREVLARILDGNDYIVEVSDSGMRVVVLGVAVSTPRTAQNVTVIDEGGKPVTPADATPPTASPPATIESIPPLTRFISESTQAAPASTP